MNLEQRKRLDAVKVRLETLQNAGSRAEGLIVRAEASGDDPGELIAGAEKELASILKRPRRGKAAQ
jgi:hypothetical protein